MRDEETGSYWQQITGAAISGLLAGKHLELVRSDELTFRLWKAEQPGGTVLDDLGEYVSEYADRDWDVKMKKVPTVLTHAQPGLAACDLMLGVRAFGASRAFPFDRVQKQKLINDRVGEEPVVLVVGPDGESVRVFRAHHGLLDVAKVLSEERIDVLICGGISREEREFISGRGVDIIDNVAGWIREVLSGLPAGALRRGFGLARSDDRAGERGIQPILRALDCVACADRKCLRGESCDFAPPARAAHDPETDRMLEASLDIASEEGRTLCRLSELIYFCLEMRYRRIGVAYCVDLQEPAAILTRVLRRFFKVYPVCCKIGGAPQIDVFSAPESSAHRPAPSAACNPVDQADALNRLGVDINVLVGMCMGADCVFCRFSDAPVTTIFVKDRSLANNPIGAVYSDYYIKEAIRAETRDLNRE